MDAKRAAAERAVEWLEDGMTVGLGTGSTVYHFIQAVGRKVADGLTIKAVATSVRSEQLARQLGIPMISFSDVEDIDVTIDGADEVDPEWNLIKGGGGALLREKIVADASKRLIVIIDESKLVRHLGQFPLPVEVVPFAFELTQRKLRQLGCELRMRMAADAQPYRTDNGNFTMDCEFGPIEQPGLLADALHRIPGVVEHGLFIGMAAQVIVGRSDGTVDVLDRPRP
ncbi:ribose-5-phosphate isomerase RpiA [Paenibacillus sp. LHD-117]|uniref:ribose-5-phosphate isomerase RpiA n=1 Tax=Paenibacillus sp. LHD-117 TaxID=3071412 RepID=UPI0027E1C22D|nr:ribose-5-phosphate isomerase RpiA [Paenibacillus sp. LHD-117]MDQ6422792.1 ribose-5-phosphate isomerase RpiA [Paenibacillus sp. LHD-117]